MLGDPESSIRLLTEAAGDRGSAHALNVTVLSLLLGRLLGLAEPELLALGLGALLHDIGKIDLPDRVRVLDSHFTDTERRLYEDHVGLGVAHARCMGVEAGVLLVVAQHHEATDGSGFPQHLKLDKLSQGALIVALVNRYDNLCNPALAACTLTPHEALSLLYAQGQRRFDTRLLGAFVRMMGVYPPGSVVQLSDGRYALVTSVNAGRLLKPCVLVHNPRVPRDEALVLNLEREPALSIRRSLKPVQLPREVHQYLAPGQRVAYFFDTAPVPLAQELAA
jgi:putative nucleotidyltransferase with HDIG domain